MANFCMQCGSKLEKGAGFCTECGAKIQATAQATGASQKTNVNRTEELARRINAEKNNQAASKKNKKKDGRNALCLILAAVLLVELAIAGFKCRDFSKKGMKGTQPVPTPPLTTWFHLIRKSL